MGGRRGEGGEGREERGGRKGEGEEGRGRQREGGEGMGEKRQDLGERRREKEEEVRKVSYLCRCSGRCRDGWPGRSGGDQTSLTLTRNKNNY